MSKDNTPTVFGSSELVLPAFRGTPAITLDIGKTREAEQRMIEVKTVNPLTFPELNLMLGDSFRELKRHISTVGFQIANAEKILGQIKAGILLDKYPEFMKNRPKSQDNADMRLAYMMRDGDYLETLDRINMLKAVESFIEGRIKVMERATSFMSKNMDLIIRSGLGNQNLYITSTGKQK